MAAHRNDRPRPASRTGTQRLSARNGGAAMPARPRQHDDDRDSMTTPSPARTCTRGLFTSSPKVTPSSSFDAAVNTRGAPQVAWNLQFTGAEPFWHLSRSWMYRTSLPRTKPMSIHPLARFDGTLTVAGRSIDVSGWPGMVGHNWGSQHAERWIWLHALSFPAAEETTWFDVVLARIRFVLSLIHISEPTRRTPISYA